MSDDPIDTDDTGQPANHSERADTENAMTDTIDEKDRTDRTDDQGGRDLRRTANYALLAGLSLLALIATLQLYFNVSSAINQWISDEYRSLFQAAFNLAVLLLASAGIAWQVRRLRE